MLIFIKNARNDRLRSVCKLAFVVSKNFTIFKRKNSGCMSNPLAVLYTCTEYFNIGNKISSCRLLKQYLYELHSLFFVSPDHFCNPIYYYDTY